MKVNRLEINSEQQLRNTLDKIYENAKNGKQFYGLLELIKNEQVILTAIHNIKSNKGSQTAGINGNTIDYFLQLPKNECIKMIRKKFDNYKPLPVKRVYIGKGEYRNLNFKQSDGRKLLALKKVRPLGIPTMLDRIIQEMIRLVIEPIFEAQFFDHSYGFRPYRSCEHAIGWITRVINKSQVFVAVEGDIEGYFDNINHNKLLQIMWNMGLKDKRVLMIIKQMLKAGYMDSSKKYDTLTGSPQGGIISPLLANIYLNNFDWHMARKYEFHPNSVNYREKKNLLAALRAKGTPQVWYVRYADDWVILTESIEYAEELKAEAGRYLNHKLKLKLSEKKTLVTDTRVKGMSFLGFNIKSGKQRFGDLTVARAIPDVRKLSPKIKEIKKDIRMIRTRKKEFDKQLDIEKINAKIVGLSNYMRMGISKDIMGAIDNRLEKTAYKTWVRMYGKRQAKKHKIPVSEFSNRQQRHKDRMTRTFSVTTVKFSSGEPVKLIVGLTCLKFTKIEYAEVFKQAMTPYTAEGRKLYEDKIRSRSRLLARPCLTSFDDLWIILNSTTANPKYNLEYFLNREYAYNRDKGKCKVCGRYLDSKQVKVHHIKPYLPMNKVNKVINLACTCIRCHRLIHSNKDISSMENNIKINIEKYRNLVSKEG